MRQCLKYEDLAQVALKRAAIHAAHASSRPLSHNYELIGLLAEEAFAYRFGLSTEYLELKPQGDGRVDFELPLTLTIDVKGAERPFNLLREADKPHADILVLAGVDLAARKVRLIGWEWDAVMVLCPKRDFGHGVINHYKRAEDLRPMRGLRARFGTIRRGVA